MAEYICKNGILRPITHIYQCVDRLVEGVDYERYDWLKSSGKSTFTIPYNPTLIDITFKAYYWSTGDNFGCQSYGSNQNIRFGINLYNGGIDVCAGTSKIVCGSVMCYNGITRVRVWREDNVGFVVIYKGGKMSNSGSVENIQQETYFRNTSVVITSKDSVSSIITNKVNLSPCQLLRPISAILDSQGKPRSAGECGMYDSISGKFFGNANTSGSFSVYND